MADDDAAILKSIVFIVAFSALFSFVFAYAAPMFDASSPPDTNSWISANFDPADIAETTFWETGGEASFNMTDDFDWNSYVEKPGVFNYGERSHDGDQIEFDSADGQTVHVFPIATADTGFVGTIENNMAISDSFLIYQEWGWWDHEWESITFDNIINALTPHGQNKQAKIHIDLKSGMDVWFLFPVGADAEAALEAGTGFTIVVGQSMLDAAEGSQNIWNTLSGLLTFNIDTGYSILNYLISLPIWITIAYVTVVVVSKLIPGLG